MRYIDWLPTAYEVAARFQPARKGRSNIYLILLDYQDRSEGPHGVYVGMSHYSPAQRFDQHKAGIRAAGSVLKRGIEVLTGPAMHLQYIARPLAVRIEVELAELISSAIKCAEKVRLVSSGTEAGITAIRIARAATGRTNIIKFDGCYHGHSDSMLVRAGSGAMTLGQPDSAGVPAALAAMTMVARYNSIVTVEDMFREAPEKIAAVIVEPIAANMGVVNPEPGFLKSLAELAHRNGALLICDEVISGFRLGFGSAAEAMGVAPDLIMLGKIIGGGMPVGAVAGPAKIMDLLAPVGPVYQAGTLSGNPLSVRAGLETLRILKESNPYGALDTAGARLEAGLRDALAKNDQPGCVNRAGSLLTIFLGPTRVRDADDARGSEGNKFAKFFQAMIERGINIPPSQFEAMFISTAHTSADIDRTIAAANGSLLLTNAR